MFIIATSLLDKDSHLVVVRPYYSTNIDTPRAIGCETTYIDLKFEEGFEVDLEAIERARRQRTQRRKSTTLETKAACGVVALSSAGVSSSSATKNDRSCRTSAMQTFTPMHVFLNDQHTIRHAHDAWMVSNLT